MRAFFYKMTDDQIYQKIKSINEKFDVIQESIDFYRNQFSDLEDNLEYYSKHSWLPDAKQNVRKSIDQMREVLSRTEKEQQHFNELEKQLDEVQNSL